MNIGPNLSYDIITELPTNVIERILACLPLMDAVRTSILSSQWRYKWVTLPNLTIDDRCIVTSSLDAAVIKSKLINFIDRILLLHRGPIEKFKLSNSKLESCSDIDQWILFLSRNGIKEIILHIRKGGLHKVPSCLFSCKQLNHLELYGCIFKSPPTFTGFNNLRSLDLQGVTLVGCTFESIISSCPLLERLTLVDFGDFIDLKINAPNLKYLDLQGSFNYICFGSAQRLAIVSIGLNEIQEETDTNKHPEHRTSNLIQVLGCLSVVEKLELREYFLKFLAVGNVPNSLPNTFNHLKKLGLSEICLNDLDEFSAALCLIKSSPKLQFLEILVIPYNRNAKVEAFLKYLETQDFSECLLSKLQAVKITGICGERPEMEFIKILLAYTPALEMMTIKLNQLAERGSRMLKELVRFRRASPKAEIEYLIDED